MRSHPLRQVLRTGFLMGVVVVATVGLSAVPAAAAPAPQAAGVIRVIDADGAPIVGAAVTLTYAEFGPESTASTGGDGTLDLTTVPGFDPANNPHYVFVSANGISRYWDGALSFEETTPIDVTGGGPTITADIPRTNPPPDADSAGVSGTITDALTGEPLLGIQVSAADDGNGDGQGASQSVLDGSYYLNFSGGELPSTAAVVFVGRTRSDAAPYGYAAQIYDGINLADQQPETPVDVTAGTTTTGIDARLVPNGLLTGVVTEAGPDGIVPLLDVQISVWNITSRTVIGGGSTAADGSYSFAVAPGTYRVQFDKIVDGNVAATQYFDHVESYDAARDVRITTREITTGVDAQFGRVPTPSPTPTPAPILPATGPADTTPWLLGGSGAVVVGLLLALRRRTAAAGSHR